MHASRITLMTLIPALAICALLAMTLVAQDNRTMPASTRVAVFDVNVAMENLEQRRDLEASITGQGESLQAQGTKRQEKIEQLEADLEVLPQGSEAFLAKLDELYTARAEIEIWGRVQQRRMATKQAMAMEEIYRSINEAIAAEAQASNIDVVLYATALGNKSIGMNMQQVTTRIELRKVLYAREGLDITDRVVNRLNVQYRNQSRGQ